MTRQEWEAELQFLRGNVENSQAALAKSAKKFEMVFPKASYARKLYSCVQAKLGDPLGEQLPKIREALGHSSEQVSKHYSAYLVVIDQDVSVLKKDFAEMVEMKNDEIFGLQDELQTLEVLKSPGHEILLREKKRMDEGNILVVELGIEDSQTFTRYITPDIRKDLQQKLGLRITLRSTSKKLGEGKVSFNAVKIQKI